MSPMPLLVKSAFAIHEGVKGFPLYLASTSINYRYSLTIDGATVQTIPNPNPPFYLSTQTHYIKPIFRLKIPQGSFPSESERIQYIQPPKNSHIARVYMRILIKSRIYLPCTNFDLFAMFSSLLFLFIFHKMLHFAKKVLQFVFCYGIIYIQPIIQNANLV